MLDELARSTNILQLGKADLGHDGAKLSACGGDTMGSWTITSGESFTGYNECGSIGTEILEEIGETVKEYKDFRRLGSGGEFIVAETCQKKL